MRAWAERAMTELRALASDHGWKRAFRIWNAALQPESESFVDQVLQHQQTKAACIAALDATPVGALVREFVAMP